jgi:hypothetical protein
MDQSSEWYIVKLDAGHCRIVTAPEMTATTYTEQWGPFNSQGEAIAKRVGLIRSGKCQPV